MSRPAKFSLTTMQHYLIEDAMGKKSAAEAEKTRKLIVATARGLFAELGFAGATTSRIAKSAGLTEGAFFHHFKDKKALFAEVVRNLQRELAQAVNTRRQKSEDPFERFIIGARASIELSQSPEYLRLVLIEAPTILGGENWREIDAVTSLSVIEPALVAIAGRDQIDPTDLRPIALMVLGLLNETAFALARHDDQITIDDVIDILEVSIRDWLIRLDKPKTTSRKAPVTSTTPGGKSKKLKAGSAK